MADVQWRSSYAFWSNFVPKHKNWEKLGQNRPQPVLIHGGNQFYIVFNSIGIMIPMVSMETSKTACKYINKNKFYIIDK